MSDKGRGGNENTFYSDVCFVSIRAVCEIAERNTTEEERPKKILSTHTHTHTHTFFGVT